MVDYRIKISYQTGDSFSNVDTTDYLELTWKKVDIAKENLIRIKEHYEMYEGINSYRSKLTKSQWFEQNLDKDWFVNKPTLYSISRDCVIDDEDKKEGDYEYRPDSHLATFSIKLKADNGNQMQMYVFWCGYFERLYSAEIEVDTSDMKVTF